MSKLVSQRQAAEKFTSPSALREFALETAAQLKRCGLSEAGDIMQAAANFCVTTGSEWLGELRIAAKTIRGRFELSQDLHARVMRIARAAGSRQPL